MPDAPSQQQPKAGNDGRCQRRVWSPPASGVNGGYFTCWGRMDGATCRTCGKPSVTQAAATNCPCGTPRACCVRDGEGE